MIKYLSILLLLIGGGSGNVLADKYHHHTIDFTLPAVQNVTEVTNVTEVANYSYDKCQGVALAMAAANNQMYMGTSKPQMSAGAGSCGGEWAGSLMFGKKLSPNTMINGNWAFDPDKDVNALGVNFHLILP